MVYSNAEVSGVPDVSVIIVNYNGGHLLTDCVQAVLASTVTTEVFVVDNASKDTSLDTLRQHIHNPRLQIIQNRKNLGFAKACNQPLAQAKGRFLLFLNPDCLIRPDTLERLLTTLETWPTVGMAGCLIQNPDGSEQAGARRRIPTPARTLVRILHLDKLFPVLHEKGIAMHLLPLPEHPVTVEAISGAFMLVRPQALAEVGPMDEQYFLHCEDLDWCMRFRAHGWKILFIPTVTATHIKGVCSADRPIFVEWHKHKGMQRFYRKFFRHQYPGWLMHSVTLAVWLRFGLLTLYHLLKKK
jgi:GT2 family glycosyltransferase